MKELDTKLQNQPGADAQQLKSLGDALELGDGQINLNDAESTSVSSKITAELKSSAGPFIIAGLVIIALSVILFYWCYLKPKRERQLHFVLVKSLSKSNREILLGGTSES